VEAYTGNGQVMPPPASSSVPAVAGRQHARHPVVRHSRGLSRLRQVRAVRCCLVAPGVIEASAVIVGAARSHAVALRLEAAQESWLVTAIEFR